MNNLIDVLSKLYISNLKLYGVNYQTEVILGINDIKELLKYERLTIEKFLELHKNNIEEFGIKISQLDESFVKFSLNKNLKLSSIKLIESYDAAIESLRTEANITGDFEKLGFTI